MNLAPVKDIVLAAGQVVKDAFHNPDSYEVLKKSDGTVVTSIDLAVNQFLKAELLKLTPDAAWVSEEEEALNERFNRRLIWIVDPIDGTQEFVSGQDGFAISVGLIVDGQPYLGCIYNPALSCGGLAISGQSLEFWGVQDKKAPAQDLITAQVGLSRREERKGLLKNLNKIIKNRIFVGGVANKLLRVSAGVDDLYISYEPKSEWDVLAGIVLAEQSGLKFKLLNSQLYVFNSLSLRLSTGYICGHEKLVTEFLAWHESGSPGVI
jgi:myo-inositol-1(or 4)-monophosphatase